jgi:hypothetical protein
MPTQERTTQACAAWERTILERTTPIRVTWPPPGLESYQGVLWRKAGELGFGGAVLVFPILLSVAPSQPFNSLGLFGGAWWLLGLTSLLGLIIVMRALGGLLGFFSSARTAALHGIDLETTLQVGADHRGDMGALLQGTRSYRSLDERHRTLAIRARIAACILFLSAATWITAGWVLSLLLASRGLLGPTGVWILTLGPAGATLLAATLAKGLEGTAVRKAVGPLFWNRWRNPGQRDAAEIWGQELSRFRVERGERVTSGRGAPLIGALSVLALAIFVLIPTASFSVAATVGPLLASVAFPRFSSVEKRAGNAEALRHLRLSPDPGISPQEAGEALHVLGSAGRGNPVPGLMKDAVRTFDTRILPRGGENPVGVQPEKWGTELFPLVLEGITPEAETFLREVASHPALAEFETLAHAQAVDVLGARLVIPLPEGTSAMAIPVPSLSQLREGSYALVARAALQLMDGDPEGAEQTLRTVLSAGFLLGEESPTAIDALVGYVLVTNAGDALESLYQSSGRQEEAEALRWVRGSTERATEMVTEMVTENALRPEVQGALLTMPARVTSEASVRGLRWEYFQILAGLSPCINPHQVLFGPDETMAEFLRSARSQLVRYPSEGAVFDVMKKGWFTLRARGDWGGPLEGMVNATLGGRLGGCAGIWAAGVF